MISLTVAVTLQYYLLRYDVASRIFMDYPLRLRLQNLIALSLLYDVHLLHYHDGTILFWSILWRRGELSMEARPTLLPIDECEEWIWDILDCTKDCGFEYLPDDDKEILIFNTNDFFVNTKSLEKIKKITGMELVQLSSHNYYTQLWFCRLR